MITPSYKVLLKTDFGPWERLRPRLKLLLIIKKKSDQKFGYVCIQKDMGLNDKLVVDESFFIDNECK